MKADSYKKRIEYFQSNKTAYRLLSVFYTFLPLLMFILYPVMVIIKGFMGFDRDFFLMLCVPAGVLLLVTISRKVITRKRPYERFDTPPLFERDGLGDSFPSRHTASAFIIAMSGFMLSIWVGIILLIISAVIGLTRYLSGVHFITDVLAGAAISLLAGTVFFIII